MAVKKRGLGKGLGALLAGGGAGGEDAAAALAAADKTVPVSTLQASRFQPRTHFAGAELSQLADSIRQHGIIQPIVVRTKTRSGGSATKHYEIIAGERRFRAAQLAGLKSVPITIANISDEEAQVFALVENLQRADLNPMEQSNGLLQLTKQLNLTHAQVAEKVGLSRAAVTNLLRLQDLHTTVRAHVESGALEMGHARALLGASKPQQPALAAKVIRQQLTTRQTEGLVRAQKSGGAGAAGDGKKTRGATGTTSGKSADTVQLEQTLKRALKIPVEIRHQQKGKGQLILKYGSLEALDALVKKLKK